MRIQLTLLALLSTACEGDIGAGDVFDEPTAETEDGSTPESENEKEEEEDDEPIAVEELGDLVGLEMEVTYESTVDGDLFCAKRVEVTGTPYTGDCDGCDFAFSIESTLTEDNSAAGCYLSDYKLLLADGSIEDVVFAHADVLEVGEGETIASYADAVFVRYNLSGYSGTYGPYTRVLSHDDGGDNVGVFERDGEDFEWGSELDGSNNGDDLVVDFCAWDYVSSWSDMEVTDGFTTGTEAVNCDGKKVDVWTLDIDSPMTLGLGVDTVDTETAFDARMIVLGPDECVTSTADDNFPCTFAPSRYECPAMELDVEPGEYQVVVHSMVNVCGEGVEMGEYTLTVDSPTPVRPMLTDDDIFRYEQIPTTTDHKAEGRLIFE